MLIIIVFALNNEEVSLINIAIDVDGSIDAFPILFQHLIAGWTAAADHVYIITGVSSETPTDADHAAKVGYLTAMGIPPEQYYQLVVLGHKPNEDVAQAKAAYIAANNIKLLIDNSVENAKAAKSECAVLLLWNVKEKENSK